MIGDEFTDFVRLATGMPTVRTVVDTILTSVMAYCALLQVKYYIDDHQ